MTKRKLIKVIYKYDSGDKEYIDCEELENYMKNMELAGANMKVHSFLGKFSPVKWKKEKGFEFQCTNKDCICRKTGVGLSFTTTDIEKAEEHSEKNNSPMWIAKKEDLNENN